VLAAGGGELPARSFVSTAGGQNSSQLSQAMPAISAAELNP
jgi:hypothetical protein